MTPERWLAVEALFDAASQQPAEVRIAWLESATDDPALRAEVLALLQAYDADPEFLEQGVDARRALDDAALSSLIGRRLGAYKLVRQVGRGGMGVVYEAVRDDQEFDRRAAVKLLPAWSAGALTERFRFERRVLASLDHPGIARLLDAGTTGDGVPYCVMEFVDGQPIDAWCQARRLGVLQRVLLFEQVCDAVAHAHRHLVVHRDVKPANILVTADGVPKLLDFGIATLLAEDGGAAVGTTHTGYTSFTPEFASPEQVRGEAVTTASDVYSLGVLLYLLLTDQRPYDLKGLSPLDAMHVVCDVDAPRMSTVAVADRRPALRGDLDTIAATALMKAPRDRYGTVAALAADLRAWREARPIAAAPATAAYRVRRFVRRNRLAVGAAAAVLTAIVAGSSVALWQAREARQQRDRAERRFNDVRRLANTVLFDYSERIEKLPGSVPVREKLVKDALEYLDRLSSESGDNLDLQRELAAAYFKVGDVQGSPSRSSLGDYAGALSSYNKSLQLREGLEARGLTDDRLLLDLARTHQLVGNVLAQTGNIPGALDHYGKGFAVYDRVATASTEATRGRATLHSRFARASMAAGRLAEAIANDEKSLALTQTLVATTPGDRELQRDLGVGHILLGDSRTEAGDLPAALADYREALRTFEALVAPNDTPSLRDLSVARERLSNTLAAQGDVRGALDITRRILTDDEARLVSDPGNDNTRRDVRVDVFKMAKLLDRLGERQEALSYSARLVALNQAAADASPGSAETRGDLASALHQRGEILAHAGATAGARASYAAALAIEEAMLAEDPTNADARGNVAESLMVLADLAVKTGDRAGALGGYLQSLALCRELAAANPTDVDDAVSLAAILERLGDYYAPRMGDTHLDRWTRARGYLQESLQIWQRLQAASTLPAEHAAAPERVAARIKAGEAALAQPASGR